MIEEGHPGDSFFIIDQGQVLVSKRMGGANREIARLMEGQFFGEMALLTGSGAPPPSRRPRTWTSS